MKILNSMHFKIPIPINRLRIHTKLYALILLKITILEGIYVVTKSSPITSSANQNVCNVFVYSTKQKF